MLDWESANYIAWLPGLDKTSIRLLDIKGTFQHFWFKGNYPKLNKETLFRSNVLLWKSRIISLRGLNYNFGNGIKEKGLKTKIIYWNEPYVNVKCFLA